GPTPKRVAERRTQNSGLRTPERCNHATKKDPSRISGSGLLGSGRPRAKTRDAAPDASPAGNRNNSRHDHHRSLSLARRSEQPGNSSLDQLSKRIYKITARFFPGSRQDSRETRTVDEDRCHRSTF